MSFPNLCQGSYSIPAELPRHAPGRFPLPLATESGYSQRSFTAEGNIAFKKAVEEAAMAYQAEKETKAPPDLFVQEDEGSIIYLGLSARAYNCLRRGGFDTVDDILALENPDELLRLRNMGIKSLEEIISKLEEKGYDVERFKAAENISPSGGD